VSRERQSGYRSVVVELVTRFQVREAHSDPRHRIFHQCHRQKERRRYKAHQQLETPACFIGDTDLLTVTSDPRLVVNSFDIGSISEGELSGGAGIVRVQWIEFGCAVHGMLW
jgi:hypothetical protein